MASLKDLSVTGNAQVVGDIYGNKFVSHNGTSSDFVKGDGSLDSSVYLTSATLATDTGVVHTTGDENVSGIKKFQSDIWLYSASGDTPGLIFQRGSNTSYIDWKVFNSAGILKFSANRNSDPLVYTDLFKINGDASYPEATLSLKLIAQSDVSVSGDIIGKLGKNATLADASILDATNHSLLGNNASTLKAVDDRPPTTKNIVDYVDDCISHITPGASTKFNATDDGIVTHIGTTGGTTVNSNSEADPSTYHSSNPQYILSSRGYWIQQTKYGECDDSQSTVAKTVNVPGYVSLVDGETIVVKFSNTNTATNPTLNVNGTGAKPIYRYGTTNVGNASPIQSWAAGSLVQLIYSGTYGGWEIANGNILSRVYQSSTASSTSKYPLMFGYTAGMSGAQYDYLRFASGYNASGTQLAVDPRGDMFTRSLSLGSKTSTTVNQGDVVSSGSASFDGDATIGGAITSTGNITSGGNVNVSGNLNLETSADTKHSVSMTVGDYYDDGDGGTATLWLDDPSGSDGRVIVRCVGDPVISNDAANKDYVDGRISDVDSKIEPVLFNDKEILSDIGTKYPYHNGYISSISGTFQSGSGRHVAIPSTGIRRITVLGPSSNNSAVGFLATYTSGTTPTFTFPTGYTTMVLVPGTRTLTLDVPEDANYIYLDVTSSNFPQSVKITGTGITDPQDEYKYHYTKLYDESVKRNLYQYNISSESGEWIRRRGYITKSNSNWTNTSSSTQYWHYLIPMTPDIVTSILVKWSSSTSTAAQLAWLTDVDPNASGNSAHLCSGTTGYIPSATNTEYEIEVPSDARYLYLYAGTNSSNYSPSSLKIIGSTAHNEVHRSGKEEIHGEKTFLDGLNIGSSGFFSLQTGQDEGVYVCQGNSSGTTKDLSFYDIEDDSVVRLKNIAEPLDQSDAATKYYVDQAVAGGGGGGGAGGTVYFGTVESTSTSIEFTANISGITALTNGLCVYLTNDVVTSASGYTININGLGPKPVYLSNTASTASTTEFASGLTLLFIYNGNRVSGGCWDLYSNTVTTSNTAYAVRHNYSRKTVTSACYRYRVLFTSADGSKYVPSNASTSTSATSSKTVTQTNIDPFGEIAFYNTTGNVSSGGLPTATYIYTQGRFVFGYAFNRTGAALTLTANEPVYIKCTPQSDGSAIIDSTTPYVQSLPTTEDGYIYIFFGIASAATYVEMLKEHPVYYYKNGAIRLWTKQMTSKDYGNGYAVDSRSDDNSPTAVTAACSDYVLCDGGRVTVYFKHDVGDNATLSINGTTATQILYAEDRIFEDVIHAGDVATFVYSVGNGISENPAYVLTSIDFKAYEGAGMGLVPRVPSEYRPADYDSLFMTGSGSWMNLEDSVNDICYGNYLPTAGGAMNSGANITGLSETPPASSTSGYRTYAASWGMVLDNFLKLDGSSQMEGNLDMQSNNVKYRIVNLEDPVDASDAATKKYVDSRTDSNWSRTDVSAASLNGSRGVQGAWAASGGTTLGWSTPMDPNTTCHVFVYGGTSTNGFTAGRLTIPRNKTATGASASSTDTIIIDNKVYYKNGTQVISTDPSFSISANEILELSVMYTEVVSGNTVYHRTIYKTAQA